MKKIAAITFAALLGIVIMAPSTPAQAQGQNQSFGTCYAYTSCPNGRTISCSVQGSSSNGVACTWWVSPYTSVSCNGYVGTSNGLMWQSYFITC